jgi:hypothetical protein
MEDFCIMKSGNRSANRPLSNPEGLRDIAFGLIRPQ